MARYLEKAIRLHTFGVQVGVQHLGIFWELGSRS